MHNIYGIVGPNGAGKTSLLKIISGILRHSDGEVYVHEDKSEDRQYLKWAVRNTVFLAAGERGLYYKNTVKDNVLYYSAMKSSNIRNTKENIEKYASLFNLQNVLDRRIEHLSTGQKKKAAILCAFCAEKPIMIMDEPSLGLDLDSAMELKEAIHLVSATGGSTIILSSHDTQFLGDLANKYMFIFNGKCVQTLENCMDSEHIRDLYFKIKHQSGGNNH